MKRSMLLLLSAVIGALVVLVPLGTGAPPTPASLTFTPTTSAGTYSFGERDFGSSISQAFTLRNSGGTASGALTISLTGSAFTKTADGCTGISIGAGKACTVTVQYSPSAAGASDSGQLSATNGKKKGPTTASLALDGSGGISGHVYWSYGGSTETSGFVGRADKDGQNVNETFLTSSPTTASADLAVDSNYIYLSNSSDGAIGRADLDGQNANHTFITGGAIPIWGVTVDSDHVYWATPSGTIGRADLNGQNVNHSFISGGSFAIGVAVDANYIYWTNYSSKTIGRADLDGQNVDQSFISLSSNPFLLTLDSGHLYWGNYTSGVLGAIGRADKSGQDVSETFISLDASTEVRGVAVDEAHVYWTEVSGIGRADLNGQNIDRNFISGLNAGGVYTVEVDVG